MAIITLLTDFGTQDEYAGVLKGVIYDINPAATIVDLTHQIAPQDITSAAYALIAAFHYFPGGSIHVAVVDPGVGTGRKIVAVRAAGHFFVAPDNGLLTPLMRRHTVDELVAVENMDLFRRPVSRTFHGRDIFAPVAARLSLGLPLEEIGPALTPQQLKESALVDPYINPRNELVGQVVTVDRFGNLITNIGKSDLDRIRSSQKDVNLRVRVADHRINGLAESYNEAAPASPLAIIGSRDCLEIAVNSGNAAETLHVGNGTPVCVCLQDLKQ